MALFFGFVAYWSVTCEWGQGNSCEDSEVWAFVSTLLGAGCLVAAALAGLFLHSNRRGKWA